MKAIILAGGRSIRMGKLTDESPKCLLEINGKKLLNYLFQCLIKNGFSEVYLSLGYKGNLVVKEFGDQYRELKIHYVFDRTASNGSWQRNTISGLVNFKDIIDEEVLIIEGDLLISSTTLSSFLSNSCENSILCSKKTLGKVVIFNGSNGKYLRDEEFSGYLASSDQKGILDYLGKEIPYREHYSEMIGVNRLSKEAFEKLCKMDSENYEDGLFLLSKEIPITVIESNFPWIDIDLPSDLKRATQFVLPAIMLEENKND